MPNNTSTPQSEQQIRERAYEIYLAREGQQGDQLSDWLAAERELKESSQPQGKKTRAAAVSL
jgi:Protein of unknown function (DUF2934)